MTARDNLKVGGCTCSDETGGCSNAKSVCACDGGGGGNKPSQRQDGCCEGGGKNGKSDGDGKDGKSDGGGSGGDGGGCGSGSSGNSGGGCGGGGGSGCGGNSGGGSGGCGGGGNSGGGSTKSGGGCGKAEIPYKPDPPFCNEKVRKILKCILLELLDSTYAEILCNNSSQKATSCVRKQVKEIKFDSRYKFVCFITVAERGQHHLPVITRTLWNPETDKCACFSHRTCSTLATILCFGMIA